MCGIIGTVGALQAFDLELGLHLLRRRGPDDRGTWTDKSAGVALGQVRLSILDPTPAGHQPMISADGRIVMIFNGEIYNFRELRAELESGGHVFTGHSDSEVLLALFARDGVGCFGRLNGIFAAAFWERDSQTLSLVRDPLGVKPLYLCEHHAFFAFASEIKALVRCGLVRATLDPTAVLAHLSYLWSPGSATIVRGVRKLLPGFALQLRRGVAIREWAYRDLAYSLDPDLQDATQATRRVADTVQRAVRRQMVSDVPLGAFLSGGLDSSAVAAFAQRELGSSARLQCFTIDIRDSSTAAEGFAPDLPYARRVAGHLGVDLHVVGVGSEMMTRLPEMLYFLDEPTADPAGLNALFISELARRNGMKVLLSGAGGDDIFTGYRRHFALRQERWWSWWPKSLRTRVARLANSLPARRALLRRAKKAFSYAGLDADSRLVSYFQWLEADRAFALLSPDFRSGIRVDQLCSPLFETLRRIPATTEPLNRMLYLEAKHFLADHNLNYTDKMGMAAGVEVRVPLLDLELVELANSLPVRFKQRGTVGKWIFKRAMEPYLPAEVIYRPKTGFGVPLREWLRGPAGEVVAEALSPGSIRSRGVFSEDAVRALTRDNDSGAVDSTYTLFSVACVELWCRQYLDGHWAVDMDLDSYSRVA